MPNSEVAEKIPHWHQCHSSPCTPCRSPVPLPWTPWEEHALLRAPSRFWGPEKGIDGFGQKNKLGKVRRAYHIQFRKGVKKQDVELRTFFSPSTAFLQEQHTSTSVEDPVLVEHFVHHSTRFWSLPTPTTVWYIFFICFTAPTTGLLSINCKFLNHSLSAFRQELDLLCYTQGPLMQF